MPRFARKATVEDHNCSFGVVVRTALGNLQRAFDRLRIVIFMAARFAPHMRDVVRWSSCLRDEAARRLVVRRLDALLQPAARRNVDNLLKPLDISISRRRLVTTVYILGDARVAASR